MNVYKFVKSSDKGTVVIVKSSNKVLFNRLDLAIEHVLKEFNEGNTDG